MSVSTGRLNASIIRRLGEPFVAVVDGLETEFQAVFQSETSALVGNAPTTRRPQRHLLALQSTVDALGLCSGRHVIGRAAVFRVTGVEPDDCGMAMIYIQRISDGV